MKLRKFLFEFTLKSLDALAEGLSRTSAMLEMLQGDSTYDSTYAEAAQARWDAVAKFHEDLGAALPGALDRALQDAAEKDRREAAKEKRRQELAALRVPYGINDKQGPWWRALSAEAKLAKRMELRAKLGRKGPPPPYREPGDWQWRVHMERQALAKDRQHLRNLELCNQGPVAQQAPALVRAKEDCRFRILKHEHTLAQLRGQHLRPKKYDYDIAALEATMGSNQVPWTPPAPPQSFLRPAYKAPAPPTKDGK